jgi:hypothetical protein
LFVFFLAETDFELESVSDDDDDDDVETMEDDIESGSSSLDDGKSGGPVLRRSLSESSSSIPKTPSQRAAKEKETVAEVNDLFVL